MYYIELNLCSQKKNNVFSYFHRWTKTLAAPSALRSSRVSWLDRLISPEVRLVDVGERPGKGGGARQGVSETPTYFGMILSSTAM